MARRRAAAFLLSVLFLAAGACSDGGLFTPNQGGPVRLALRPYFAFQDGGSGSLIDIHRIRITVTKLPERERVGQTTVTVDPGEAAWPVDLDVPGNSDLEILIELVNVTNGVETVAFSGVVNVRVTSGPQPTPAPVPVFPGPPENLRVTSVVISPRNQSVLEGDAVQLSAAVTGGPSNPVVTWSSLNSSVATVDGAGKVTTHAPGQAIIGAQVGPKTDNVTFTVGARAVRVAVTPASPAVNSLNTDVTFTGKVVDARNNEVPGLDISWSIADATIATQVGPGVFRVRRNGNTTITGTAVQNGRSVTGTAVLKVEQKAVSIAMTPASASFNAFGATQAFEVRAKDGNGNDVEGVSFTWTSSDPAVAAVDANGVVTAVGNGTAIIKAAGAGTSAQATVTVQQAAASLTITPSEARLRALNQTVQLRVEMKDARGNLMTAPVTWSSAFTPTATVDANGLVTATGDGAAVILARAAGQTANATIFVERIATRVVLAETERKIDAGTSFQLRGTVVDANGFAMEDQTITWATNKPAVAAVSSTGLVTGISAGEAEITAKGSNAFGVARITVVGVAHGFRVNSNGRVLLINADGGQGSFVRTNLVSTGLFASENIDDVTMGSTPTAMTTLSGYGAVFVWTNFSPSNPVAWGDRLKEYVDAGGKVVMAVYAYSNLGDPWDIQGGIMTAGYSPLVNTNDRYNLFQNEQRTLNFSTALTSHQILAGVTEFQYGGNSNYTRPQLAAGATLVANNNDGIPLIGINTAGSVIGFNLYPGNAFTKSAGVWKALANALK
ncbi:MAG: Ig-like domain-containing protein [Gemmatimonadota bacterium]